MIQGAASPRDVREATLRSPEFLQFLPQLRTVSLFRARWEEPGTALHDTANELLRERFPGVTLTYPDVLKAFGTEIRDPLLSLPDPATADCWLQKGLILRGEGLWCNGLASLDKALAVDAERADAWAAKGTGLLMLALAVCRTPTVRLFDGDVPLQAELLHVHATLDRAGECFEQALSLCPTTEEAIAGKTMRGKCCVRFCANDLAEAAPDYTNDEHGPTQYLRQLRRSEDAKPVMLSMKECELAYKDNPDMLKLARKGLPSRDDSDVMLQGIMNDLLLGLPEAKRRFVSGQIAVGELFLRNADAGIRPAPDPYKGYVIVVRRGLREILHSLGKVLLATAETTPGTYVGPAPTKPRCTDEDAARHLKQVMTLLGNGRMPHLPPTDVVLQDGTCNFLGLLEVYGTAFVLGHELGHLLCGHMRRNPSAELEIEVDRAGLILMLNWLFKELRTEGLRDHHLEAALTGAELVLVCQRILEDLGLSDTKNHPTMARRFEALRESTTLPGTVFDLPNKMMGKALELRNLAVGKSAGAQLGLVVE